MKAPSNPAALAAWQKILQGVKELDALYDADPEMNDTQPMVAETCIPMSLDEWASQIEEVIEYYQAN